LLGSQILRWERGWGEGKQKSQKPPRPLRGRALSRPSGTLSHTWEREQHSAIALPAFPPLLRS